MEDIRGQQLGNYRLIRLIGQGGFADVYQGEHIYLKTPRAIKVLHAHLAKEGLELFLAEAQTIERLQHRHIVRIYDFGINAADSTPFLVMEYAPAGSLRGRYPRGTRLPLALVVEYTRQVAEALQYAHDRRLIHRDVKPENMLIGQEGEILLSDFGIAIIAHSTRSQATEVALGTIAYMAPEQLQGKPRPASDQYALGIVVYEWLSGVRPFYGTLPELVSQHVSAPPPPLHEKVPGISPQVEQVVMTALAKEAQQRFGSVQDFAHNLAQAVRLSSSSASFALPPVLQPLPPPVSSPRTPISAPLYGLSPTQPATPPPGAIGYSPTQRVDTTGLAPTQPASPPTGITTPVASWPHPAYPPPEAGLLSPQQPPIPPPPTRHRVLSYVLLTSILGILTSILLSVLGKLPTTIAYIALGIGLALVLITLIWSTTKKLEVWNGTRHTPVYAASIVSILALTALALVASPLLSASSTLTGNHQNRPTGNNSPVTSATAPANTSPSPAASSTTTGSWHTIFRQVAPFCNNPQGVTWQTQASSAHYSSNCTSSGTLIQQNSDPTSMVEVDLTKVNGAPFHLTTFRAQFDVSFQDPNGFAKAGFFIVPATATSGVDGYLFAFAGEAGGLWEVDHITDRTNVYTGPPINSGQVIPIEPGTPPPSGAPQTLLSAKMTVEVQNGEAFIFFNGTQVGTQIIGNMTSPTFALALIGYSDGVVQFANFELDAPGNG